MFQVERIPVREKKEIIYNDSLLKVMNNVFMPQFVDTCNNNKEGIFKILVIGNSLSYHSGNAETGWYHVSGMAASSQAKDFVHLLFNYTEKIIPNKKLCLRVSNFAKFERNPNSLKKIPWIT